MTRSPAQRAADARYEAKRARSPQILLRLGPGVLDRLDALRMPGESRQAGLLRRAGMGRQ
jgi:hypothetical protein